MKKSRLVSTRLKDDDARLLEEIARDENIDKSTLMRKWILSKIKEYKIKEAAEKYRKGLISLEEGATMADVSIWEFIDYVRQNNIWPPPQSEEELKKELTSAKRLLERG